MKWLIYCINFALWFIASLILGSGLGSALFGIIYFVVGYPLSLIVLKFSDHFAVSFLDKLNYSLFSFWFKKLVWSNGVATAIIWVLILILIFIFGLQNI